MSAESNLSTIGLLQSQLRNIRLFLEDWSYASEDCPFRQADRCERQEVKLGLFAPCMRWENCPLLHDMED